MCIHAMMMFTTLHYGLLLVMLLMALSAMTGECERSISSQTVDAIESAGEPGPNQTSHLPGTWYTTRSLMLQVTYLLVCAIKRGK